MTQIAGGAAVGLGVEVATSTVTGQKIESDAGCIGCRVRCGGRTHVASRRRRRGTAAHRRAGRASQPRGTGARSVPRVPSRRRRRPRADGARRTWRPRVRPAARRRSRPSTRPPAEGPGAPRVEEAETARVCPPEEPETARPRAPEEAEPARPRAADEADTAPPRAAEEAETRIPPGRVKMRRWKIPAACPVKRLSSRASTAEPGVDSSAGESQHTLSLVRDAQGNLRLVMCSPNCAQLLGLLGRPACWFNPSNHAEVQRLHDEAIDLQRQYGQNEPVDPLGARAVAHLAARVEALRARVGETAMFQVLPTCRSCSGR